MNRVCKTLLALGILWPQVGIAEEEPKPHPCEANPGYHQFDFWVGTWDVYVGKEKAGTNIISREEKGCLLLEKWTDANGNTGQSYNYYNPATDEWRQVWVSGSIIIDYSGGLTGDGAMELTGELVFQQNQKQVPFKGIWTPQDDGTVRQHFEQFDAESDAWKPVFTGIYHRVAE